MSLQQNVNLCSTTFLRVIINWFNYSETFTRLLTKNAFNQVCIILQSYYNCQTLIGSIQNWLKVFAKKIKINIIVE